jgi:hypothetical protein
MIHRKRDQVLHTHTVPRKARISAAGNCWEVAWPLTADGLVRITDSKDGGHGPAYFMPVEQFEDLENVVGATNEFPPAGWFGTFADMVANLGFVPEGAKSWEGDFAAKFKPGEDAAFLGGLLAHEFGPDLVTA